jgi:hypothetical protein
MTNDGHNLPFTAFPRTIGYKIRARLDKRTYSQRGYLGSDTSCRILNIKNTRDDALELDKVFDYNTHPSHTMKHISLTLSTYNTNSQQKTLTSTHNEPSHNITQHTHVHIQTRTHESRPLGLHTSMLPTLGHEAYPYIVEICRCNCHLINRHSIADML